MSLLKVLKHLPGKHNQSSHAGSRGSLQSELEGLKPQLAKAAQKVLDEWEQDEEGFDCELGGGGACDLVSSAMSDVIYDKLPDVEIVPGGQEGDDHAWIVAYRPSSREAFGVDIPPGAYETGGGYSWTKIPDAKVSARDVDISPVDYEAVEGY